MSESGKTDDTLVGTSQRDVHYSSLQNKRIHSEKLRDICLDMFTHDIKDGSEQDGIEERTTMLKEYTEGNIEILDYLQGISGLERDFTRLADSIVNAATTLSDRNNVVHSNRIYEKDTGASVDKCWQYISQLSEAIHFHISKSHEYHKLHHEIWAARMEMQQVLSSYSLIQEKLSSLSLLTDDSLATIKKMIEAQLITYMRLSGKSKEFLEKSRTITPIFLRNPLSNGKHSACLLASLRLPSGKWIHRGDPVKVWGSSPIASKLHHEWNAQTSEGEQLHNAPSICFWLTSPENSPKLSKQNQLMLTEIEGNFDASDSNLSTKVVSRRFHDDLCSSWRIAVNLFATILIPTCRNYVKTLEKVNQPVVVEDTREFNGLLKLLHSLLEYGNDPALEIVKMLSLNSLEAEGSAMHVKNENIHQLKETVAVWETFLQNLNAEERGMMQDEANEQSRLILDTVRTDLNFRPSTYVTKKRKSRNSHKHSSTISSGMKGVNEDKQLVTSFTNSIPKTFKLNNSDSACDHREYEEPLMKHSLNAQITQIPSQDHVKFTKQTRELMTQIDSPFYSAVVYCPSCSEFHEISILSPFACKAETYSSNIQSLSETSDTSESHLKAAHSMPSLHMTTKNINFDEDRILAVGNKNSSVSRKFFRSKGRNKPRPQSVSASLTETTASSGLDSPSESSIVVKNKKCSSKSHRRVDGETHKEEAGKSPFLWWYKRGKRIPKDVSLQAPGSPYTEPGPPGRRSPLNIAPSEPTSDINKQSPTPFAVVERNRRNSNEETGPVVHSYSWIQRGMPWGCNPPIAAQRSPHAQQERSRHVNVHSERIKVKTRKHLKHHSFERNIDHHPFGETHLYNTIDSGIQTDTDIYPTGNLDIPLLDSEPDLQQVPMNSEYICQYCNRSMRKIVHQDSSVQCDFINCDILSKTLCHKMAPVSSQTVQVTNQIPRGRFITNSVRVWNVSCQVGTVKRNQSTEPITTEDISCYKASVYDKGEDTRRYAKYNERPRSFETPMRRLTQLGLPTGTTPAPLMFSVSCQIGPSLKAVRSDEKLTSDQICDTQNQKMKYFNQVCDTSSFVTHAPVMIGKKFQVSMPSTTQLDVSTQIHMKEKVLSDLNVSYGKSSIGDKMIDEESSFILTDFTIQNICSELLSHLTKATDCDDLVLSSETSTQIGLIKPTAIVSRVDYNQKDSSTQTDLPYIYITETKNTSSWKTDLNKNNEKYTKGIYKQPNDYMVDERIPKSGTADISTTRKDSLKFVANSEPIVDSSSRLLLNTSSHNEILNHYISTTDMHQTDLIPNTQIKRTFASTQYGEVEFHSWTNESLPPQQIKGIVNKQKKVRRNLTEIPVNRKLTNRRAVSTYGDVIMNIELHGTRCKRSIRECDYLYTIEKMHDHKCLIPTSSSSSCEGIDDLCDSCRLKYYKPVQMNIEMKAFHRCHRKLKRLGSHYKSRYPDNRDIHLRTFTRCLSADNLDMSKQKGDIIKPVTAKRS